MTDIKAFRNKYGLTQPQLAVYLGVSLSMIKMAEAGKRTLSAAALVKLHELSLASNDLARLTQKTNTAVRPASDKSSIAMVNKRLAEVNSAINKLEQQLNGFANRLQKGSNKLGLVKILSAAAHAKKKDSSLLRLLELEATAVHNSTGYTKQQLLQIQLESLYYQRNKLLALLQQ